MVVCRFFLQGNCKFGDQCKFDHQLNDNYQSNTSILRQQKFNTNPNPPNPDANALVETVVSDMLTAENGKQWLLSCYSPSKDTPCFPGFEEQSFEEVRWGFYDAKANGTVNQYCQQLQMAMQNSIMQMRRFQNPTPEMINFIISLSSVQNPPAAYSNSQNQIPTAESIFAAANKNLFGPQQSNSIFANSPFIQQQPIQERLTPFKDTQQPPFSMTSQNTSPFFKTDMQPTSVNTENTSPFFKTGTTTTQQNVSSAFLNSNTPQVTQSVFNTNIFGNKSETNQHKIVQDDSFYSKLEDFNETDLKIFQSENFEFGNIPEKPPTKEMCI